MISNVKSMFSGTRINQTRTFLAPYWRKLVVLFVSLLGLALFFGAEYGLGNLIANGQFIAAVGILIIAAIVVVVIGYPLWGYGIWFFLSCYLTLFKHLFPARYNFDLLMLGSLTFILIARALSRKELSIKPSIEEVFLILAFIYEFIIRYEFNTSAIVSELKHLFVSPLFFYFVAKNVVREKKHIYGLIIVIIVTGASWALMGIYEQTAGKMWLAALIGGDRGLYAGIRSAGPAGNYHVYGNMLTLTILLCLHIFKWMKKFHSKLIVVITCLISLVGLYYGYSRAPYIAFALSMIIMLIMAKYTKKAYATLIVTVAFVAALVILPHITSSTVLTKRFTSPVDARMATNVTSKNMFKANYLFGVGTGKYRISVPDYVQRGHTVYASKVSGLKNDYSQAHSEYFLKLCELGIIGFILIYGTYILFLYRFIKIKAKLPKNDVVGHDLICLACAFIIAVFFTMITDQMDPFLYAMIFAVLAIGKNIEHYAVDKNAIEPA